MLNVEENDGILVASFKDTDRFNALQAEEVKNDLLEYFSRPNTRMVIDLQEIRFIDSSGFSVFLSVMKAANNNYGQFKICSVQDDVKELFKVLQLHTVFDIYDSRKEAVDTFI